MKRTLAALIAVLMLLPAVCARAAEEPEAELTEEDVIAASLDTYITPDKIARRIAAYDGRRADALERLDETADEETLRYYIGEFYGVDPDEVTDLAIYRAGGAEAFEVAVLRMTDADAAKDAADARSDYIDRRAGDFAGYEPEQARLVEESVAVASKYGDAALLICQDPDFAQIVLDDCYGWFARWPMDPAEDELMALYDTSAILVAWESGDVSGLSEKDAAILDKAGQIVDQCVTDDMTDYEKERALYGWVTENVRYDQAHYDPLATIDPDSYDPYGPLYNGKGVCLGYASTFQLLMDMAGVPCRTVLGAAYEGKENHAWNMVELNGNWYCADPTWDEGDAEEEWDYFNVTSDWMAGTDHQWDYDAVPEAVTEDGGLGA